MLEIREIEAEGPDLETFREFLQEYQSYLGIDLCFQNFQKELANPLGRYTPPKGIVMLAHWNGEVAACGALQDLGEGNCELKRIYVRPDFRRKGIARSVSEYLMRRAEEIGYRAARLDTLKRLEGALELYRSLGFSEIAPYNVAPEPDIVYMERALGAPAP
ncbi:MAG: hypothetical protein QOJ65_2514 [Fimbriimonadaceae bacterium]|jgi:ribosomal protein S18 acetylase RimI-like enzyme|nr:hypothetical protein [Fimbriimonadaceae bacterium]